MRRNSKRDPFDNNKDPKREEKLTNINTVVPPPGEGRGKGRRSRARKAKERREKTNENNQKQGTGTVSMRDTLNSTFWTWNTNAKE
eukprot:scaffold19042_cov53-Attheya_sp.AAC.7